MEIRVKIHNPSRLHLKDGTRLDEPPAIEGYLDRIKPATQTKQPLYVASHDGYLFTMSPERAYPPSPPGTSPEILSPKDLKEAEVCRGGKQVLSSHGVLDLRNILAVRRAFHHTPRHTHEDSNNDDEVGVWQELERTDSDDEDKGGEEGLATVPDKPRKHMRRSFELLMVTGHVVRLEVGSSTFFRGYDYPQTILGALVHRRFGVDPSSACSDNILEETTPDGRQTGNGPSSPRRRTCSRDAAQTRSYRRPEPSA